MTPGPLTGRLLVRGEQGPQRQRRDGVDLGVVEGDLLGHPAHAGPGLGGLAAAGAEVVAGVRDGEGAGAGPGARAAAAAVLVVEGAGLVPGGGERKEN